MLKLFLCTGQYEYGSNEHWCTKVSVVKYRDIWVYVWVVEQSYIVVLYLVIWETSELASTVNASDYITSE